MQNVQETNLAWALIEVVKPHLNVRERNFVFVTTGAGDTFAAIHQLLKLIAAKGIPLRPSLVRLCVTWLNSYAFHDEEQYLRRLIEGFLLPDAIRALTAAWVNPYPPTHVSGGPAVKGCVSVGGWRRTFRSCPRRPWLSRTPGRCRLPAGGGEARGGRFRCR
jgi:hypothetical protein